LPSDQLVPLKQTQLKIAMVGSGFIARAHSNAFNQVSHFFENPYTLQLRLVCAREQVKLEKFARTWGWSETTMDWHEAVTRADIDVVDIAVPNAMHAPIALAALEAGKMVWCEKPLALGFQEAETMAAAAKKTPNLVWFNYRRVPAVSLAKQLIEEGKLGQVYHYRGHYFNQSGMDPAKGQTWRYRRSEAGSGAIGDLLSHLLDNSIWLNGAITEVTAMQHTFLPGREVDDAVAVMARFENGSLGTFEASRFGVGRRNGIGFEIYGSKGSLAFDLEDMNRLQFYNAADRPEVQGARSILVTGPDQPYSANFWKPGHLVGYEHTFIATLGDFLQCLSQGKEFHPNFRDGAQVQVALDAVQASAKSGVWEKLEVPK
jgi:myo-inositol 2-dehydrogenase/D-chiro-inositol 1-dehydrogenase